ncbi:hypothetical protein FRC02_004645 [Tulasnella sp. 418]|nr:hypothetical protein FRC02_004645 [Tulasnella sp. 418]
MHILGNSDTKGDYKQLPTEDDQDQTASGSSERQAGPLLPRFEDHATDELATSGELTSNQDPPPEFTTYEPTYFTGGQGHVISHDPHLNEDGEALYRFLLSQANIPPQLFLHCRGDHTEWRNREVVRFENGKRVVAMESYTETVVDFDFTIDVSSYIMPNPNGPLIWSVSDHEAAYRGKMIREVDNKPHTQQTNEDEHVDVETALVQHTLDTVRPTMGIVERWRHRRRRATKKEREQSAWSRNAHHKWGIPPWQSIVGQEHGLQSSIESDHLREQHQLTSDPSLRRMIVRDEVEIPKPNKTLREWADEYCASNKMLKEFVFEKKVYGWNLESLQNSVIQAIHSSHYQHQPKVSWNMVGSEISVMPDTRLARMLTRKWLMFFLWITLIYPLFIWPFKRFHSRGGGEWRVAGSAFAMSTWVHKADSTPGETVEQYSERTAGTKSSANARPPLLRATASGVCEHQGTREGEWFAEWEDTIMNLVMNRTQAVEPIRHPCGSVRTAGIGLDGYYRD